MEKILPSIGSSGSSFNAFGSQNPEPLAAEPRTPAATASERVGGFGLASLFRAKAAQLRSKYAVPYSSDQWDHPPRFPIRSDLRFPQADTPLGEDQVKALPVLGDGLDVFWIRPGTHVAVEGPPASNRWNVATIA